MTASADGLTVAHALRFGLRLAKRPTGYAVLHQGREIIIRPDAPAAVGFLRLLAAALTEPYTLRIVK